MGLRSIPATGCLGGSGKGRVCELPKGFAVDPTGPTSGVDGWLLFGDDKLLLLLCNIWKLVGRDAP